MNFAQILPHLLAGERAFRRNDARSAWCRSQWYEIGDDPVSLAKVFVRHDGATNRVWVRPSRIDYERDDWEIGVWTSPDDGINAEGERIVDNLLAALYKARRGANVIAQAGDADDAWFPGHVVGADVIDGDVILRLEYLM